MAIFIKEESTSPFGQLVEYLGRETFADSASKVNEICYRLVGSKVLMLLAKVIGGLSQQFVFY